ncbi:hypothetical protein M1146_05935, partial [Patescibacteria group bacterium]|nr:hypothetical protein [Patescibacteria group bacterium]
LEQVACQDEALLLVRPQRLFEKPVVLQVLLIPCLIRLFFNLSEGEQRLLMSEGIGQGIFFAGNTHVAIRVVASPKEHQLITSNPAEILARQGHSG